jgi:hypothetical protein
MFEIKKNIFSVDKPSSSALVFSVTAMEPEREDTA